MNAESAVVGETDTERRARSDVFAALVYKELDSLKEHVDRQAVAMGAMSTDHAKMRESMSRIEASIMANTAVNKERLEWDQRAHERWKAWGVGLGAVLLAVGSGILGVVELVRKVWSH